MSDFRVRISAVDDVSARVDKINAAILSVGKTAQKTTQDTRKRAQQLNVGDLLFSMKKVPVALSEIGTAARVASIVSRQSFERTRQSLADLREQATKVGDAFGAFSPAFGGLVAATTLAGIGELVNHFGQFGNQTAKNAAQLGISRRETQIWGRTFEKAGFEAADGLGAIASANQALLKARTGDPTAFGIADYLKLDTSGTPQKFVLSLADAIKRLRDSGQSVATLGNILSDLGFDPKLLPLYEKGGQALLNLLDAQRQLSLMSDDAVERGAALNKSLIGLKQSAGDLANEIGNTFAPQVDQLSQKFSAWLQDLKNSPDELKATSAVVETLGAAFGAALIGRLTLLTAKFVGLTGAIQALLGVGSGLASFLGLYAVGGAAAVLAGGQATGKWAAGQGGVVDFSGGPMMPIDDGSGPSDPSGFGRLGAWWRSHFGTPRGEGTVPPPPPRMGMPAPAPGQQGSSEQMIRGAIAAAGGNAMAQAGLLSNFDAESRGLSTFAVNPKSGATGWAQWLGPRKRRLAEIAASMGVAVTDPTAQAALLKEELSGPYAGVLSRMNAANSAQAAALIGLRGFEGVNEENSLLAGAPWDLMVATHIAKANAYLGPGMPQAAPLPSPLAAQGDSADTHHQVDVNFVNAPPGMRTGLVRADGPGAIGLRTSYSMSEPW